ncbi:uncharacterized protein [Aegilops tauschii subsp. strangulata]|nr:pumilio homolog 2-like [Aegilops tauschii subsp. strangulata]XP_045083877.1 pumilio homolog 2-like [Aegilops tauschii subsp. strangulata]
MDRSGRSDDGNNDGKSTGHPDLAASLGAMGLGNSSPQPREQQEQALQRQQRAAWLRQRTAPPVMPEQQFRTSLLMASGLEVARQSWSQQSQQHQAYRWEEMGSSSGGGPYVSPMGAAAAAANNPSAWYDRAAAAANNPSAWYNSAGGNFFSRQGQSGSHQQQQYTLSASASQYQPVTSPVAASANANASLQYLYQQQYAMFNQSGAGAYAWSAPDDDKRMDLRLRAIRATQAQAGHVPYRAAPAAQPRHARTLEETRSRLLKAPIDVHVVTFPQSPAHVVTLLEEGVDKIRLNVLAGVTHRMHDFMDSRDGHAVFVALLRACASRAGEVKDIVEAAFYCRHNLLPLMTHDHGEDCLAELMAAAAPYPNLCEMLVNRFLFENVLLDLKGDQVLHHCFATMRYEDTKFLVVAVLDGNTLDSMAYSKSPAGSKCLVECFNNARGDEFGKLRAALLDKAIDLARGEYSNYFVQHALEHGDAQTRQQLVQRLMGQAVGLSLHRSGSYVVEACFNKAGLLNLVVAQFMHMDDAQLVELVQGRSSNYVVHRMLEAAKDRYPKETLGLARRIYRLHGNGVWQVYAEKVMRVVGKILARHSHHGPSYR